MSAFSPSGSSLIGIRASAGSGKTYRLTIEYLRYFFRGADAENILATTFTRTAAAEILARVLRRMAEACVDKDKLASLAQDLKMELDTAEVQKQLKRFCASLERVSIGTIDSFFGGISSCYKYETDLPPGGSIYDESCTAAKRVRIAALRTILSNPDRESVLLTIDQIQGGSFGRSVITSIDKSLCDLLSLYQTTRQEHWEFAAAPEKMGDDEYASAAADFANLTWPVRNKIIENALRNAHDNVARSEWDKFLSNGITTKILAGQDKFAKVVIPDDVVRAFQTLIKYAAAALLMEHSEKTRATYSLLNLLSPEYNKSRSMQGIAFFSDVPLALSKLMEEVKDDDIAFRLNRRIDHLLLDEFQDTDPQQSKILTPFIDKINSLKHISGSVFWVGDVKQAIYGWRGARAGIFGQLEQKYPTIAWDELSKSYRSSKVILDAVNKVFTKICECETFAKNADDIRTAAAWCDGYTEHQASRDLPGYVSIIEAPASVPDDEYADAESAPPPGETYAEFVAKRIAEIYYKIPQRSIGILTRTNDLANKILFQLLQKGIPATALAGSPLTSDPAAALLLAVLALADRPGDKFAAFRILNSPLADMLGVTDLNEARLNTVSEHIRQILTESGYAATLVSWAKVIGPQCDKRGARRLTYLVELADKFDQSPGLRPRDFLDIARDAGCSDPSESTVQVMTIHKAKGLEFDCVILPELHKTFPARVPQVFTYTDTESLDIIGVARYAKAELRALDSNLTRMYDQYRSNEITEALCVLYVALTRPRYALTIITPPKRKNLSMISLLRDQLCPDAEAGDNGLLYTSGDPQWWASLPAAKQQKVEVTSTAAPTELPDVPQAGRRLHHHAAPSSLEGLQNVRVEQLLGGESREGRRTGTIIHSFFQQVRWIEDGLPDTDTLVHRTRQMYPDTKTDRLYREAKLFNEMLNNPVVRQALKRPFLQEAETAELWVERDFATFIDGKYVKGIFDRVVIISKDGKPISANLIDYKTSDLSNSTPERETEKYKSQMQTYQQALSEMLAIPESAVTCGILFPSAGIIVNL
jgi:ATP-dependent exoDNAse (exonuclease V) beta subunit